MNTGIFYRVKRGESWKSIDFGELTFLEREEFLERMDADALRRTIQIIMIASAQNDDGLGRTDDCEVD